MAQTANRNYPLVDGSAGALVTSDLDAIRAAITAIDADMVLALASGGGNTAQFPGLVIPFVGTARWYPSANVTLNSIDLFCGVAPTAVLTVDVLKNGVSIFPGDKPQLAIGQFSINTLITPGVTLTTNDYVTLSIISGSCYDLTIRLNP